MNVLVRKVDLNEIEEINLLKETTNYTDYIIVDRVPVDSEDSEQYSYEQHRTFIDSMLKRNETFIKQVVTDYHSPAD